MLLNAGGGNFTPGGTYSVVAPGWIATGDVNADGHLDIAAPVTTSGMVKILPGNGNGSFAASLSVLMGFQTHAVTIGDIDLDGVADLAVANSNSASISVALGLGNGTFSGAVNFATGSKQSDITICDVNADSKPDVITTNQSASKVTTLFGCFNTGIIDQKNTAVSIYPDPCRSFFYLKCDACDYSVIKIMDARGRCIHEQKLQGSLNRIDLPIISPGVYFVCLSGGADCLRQKLLITD